MIIGECPYEDCNGPLWIPIADKTPMFQRHDCETCGRPVWTRHSRLDPWSMTEADFLTEYRVDEEAKTISPVSRDTSSPQV